MRYELHRLLSDNRIHVIVGEATFYTAVPDRLRRLGTWKLIDRGDTSNLWPHYRLMLSGQEFVIIYQTNLTKAHVEMKGSNDPSQQR